MLHYLDDALKAAPVARAAGMVFENVSRRKFLQGTTVAGFAIAAFPQFAGAFPALYDRW